MQWTAPRTWSAVRFTFPMPAADAPCDAADIVEGVKR
jgi:hypothetical protein